MIFSNFPNIYIIKINFWAIFITLNKCKISIDILFIEINLVRESRTNCRQKWAQHDWISRMIMPHMSFDFSLKIHVSKVHINISFRLPDIRYSVIALLFTFIYESRTLSLFHVRPGWDTFPGGICVACELGSLHISHGAISLDTSDFTQYIDRHSKPARPVRSQSFISFSLRSGSLVL